MAGFTQANRPMAFRSPLGPDALLLERFVGVEQISGLFEFQADLLSPEGKAVPFDKLLGRKATISVGYLRPKAPRFINGVVNRLSQGEQFRTSRGKLFLR